jgi:alkanesulfonate monooxygenase SsuD/methylene tetrahydromethanopterin reductase-like flavin-dependent oxidoreductase (luciferase family)
MPPPTRLGLLIPTVSGHEGFDRVVAIATAAESAGFDTVWVADTTSDGPFEMGTVLGGLAARTTRVHLGALVGPEPTRHPALLAKQLTAVDVLSGGRAVLGFDARSGDAPRDLDRLEEALRIARAMFTEDTPTFVGNDYGITAAANRPPPLQAGGVPIAVACGDAAALRLAARHADTCLVTGPESTMNRTLEGLSRLCAEVGRDPSTITTMLVEDGGLPGSEEGG